MKQEVLEKIKQRIVYIEKVEELKIFWTTNSEYIKKITVHYFSFSNPQSYSQNPSHWDNLVQNIVIIETEQLKQKLENLSNELEDTTFVGKYIELLNREFSINNQFSHQFKYLEALNNYNKDLEIQKVISNEQMMNINSNIYNIFTQSISNIKQNLDLISQSLSTINFFDLLKDRNENLVLIGANGSGKSTFSRQIKNNITNQFSSFVAVIPAQKTFGIQNNSSIPLKAYAYSEFSRSHTNDKLFKDYNDMGFANSEFGQMLNYLIAEHQEVANNTHKNYSIAGFVRKNSILEDVINIWESIILHIKLAYDGQGNIKAKSDIGQEYDFMKLSDGEKNIFYCISSVLLVEKDGYIIVDEPENHLNMSIVNKLWDKLEKERSDCQFVYLTHNPSFVIGRVQAKILWIKKYTPPSNWEYVEIPIDDVLPQELIVELVGSKKNILFCEGKKNSYDYKLYSILFKKFTIIPTGGHQKAIDYCKAFNGNNELFNLGAIAIIDKDFYETEEITAWNRSKIYTLDVMEVENILCDDELLKHIQLKVHATDEEYHSAKEQIFVKIEESKNNQAMEYTRFKTDKILNSLVGKSLEPEQLKEQLTTEIKQLSPKQFYDEHIQLLNAICTSKNYNSALNHYNNKGMLSFVGDRILKGYKDRVIGFIRESEEIQNKLLIKYFNNIPND
jgi:ABC-type cobalamin/Fe3+-siderophores transport system ATPase subunit